MSTFDQPSDDSAYQAATTDPLDYCQDCKQHVDACACDRDRCAWCGGGLHRWPDFAPYCCSECSASAEAEGAA